MVYPFFCITFVDLHWHYPQTVSETLTDLDFDRWIQPLRRLSRWYLLTAVSIPLIALVLIAVTSNMPRRYLLIIILTTAIGFAASFLTVQFMDEYAHHVGKVLKREAGMGSLPQDVVGRGSDVTGVE